MIYNIAIMASPKVSKPDNKSKTVGFPSSAAEKTYAFRDNLKAAARRRGQNELKSDDSTPLRKELVNKAESKLKSLKKIEMKDKEKVKSAEEIKEEKTDKKEIPIKEILTKLEELVNMQQMGDISADKQIVVLESIKEALKELSAVQTVNIVGLEAENLKEKVSELIEVLDGLQAELKTDGRLIDKEASENFIKELKSIVEDTSAKVETASKKPTDKNIIEKADSNSNEPTIGSIAAAGKSEKSFAANEVVENGNMIAASGMTNAAVEKQNNNIKPEAIIIDTKLTAEEVQPIAEAVTTDTKLVNKEAQPTVEENDGDIKITLDGKVEKATVSGRESSKQDTEAETNKEPDKEAVKEVHKLDNKTQNKPVNEEMTSINLEKTVIENKIETVQNQTAAPKAQTVNKTEIINQIVKKAEIILADAQSEMRMQLEPENLGKLTLKIAVEKGLITAKFVAESHEVKQIIESNFNELKDMLQEKGLEVQNFSVSVGQDNSGYNNSNAFHQWKETVKLNGRNISKGNYEGYLEGEGTAARTANPYSVHNGEFDHRA